MPCVFWKGRLTSSICCADPNVAHHNVAQFYSRSKPALCHEAHLAEEWSCAGLWDIADVSQLQSYVVRAVAEMVRTANEDSSATRRAMSGCSPSSKDLRIPHEWRVVDL